MNLGDLAFLTLPVVVIAIVVFLVILFKTSWRVAEPDEALVISGLRSAGPPEGAGETMGFRIVTGRGALVIPGLVQGAHRCRSKRTRARSRSPASASRRSGSTSAASSSTRSGTTTARSPTRPAGSSTGLPRSSNRRSRTCSSVTCGRSRGR